MGNESVVLWLSAELATAYFLSVLVAMLGVLQIGAARWERAELRWLPARLARPAGALLVLAATAIFYLRFYDLIFVPGPAGLELILLFAGATALAVWLTRALSLLVGAAT